MYENFTIDPSLSNNRRTSTIHAMPDNGTDPKGGPRGQSAPKPTSGGDKPKQQTSN